MAPSCGWTTWARSWRARDRSSVRSWGSTTAGPAPFSMPPPFRTAFPRSSWSIPMLGSSEQRTTRWGCHQSASSASSRRSAQTGRPWPCSSFSPRAWSTTSAGAGGGCVLSVSPQHPSSSLPGGALLPRPTSTTSCRRFRPRPWCCTGEGTAMCEWTTAGIWPSTSPMPPTGSSTVTITCSSPATPTPCG